MVVIEAPGVLTLRQAVPVLIGRHFAAQTVGLWFSESLRNIIQCLKLNCFERIVQSAHLTQLLSDIVFIPRHDVLDLPQPQDVPGVHHQARRQRQHHRQKLGHDHTRARQSRVN